MLGINNSINNSNYRNNSPKFGMAIKLDSSAVPVIKKQAAKMRSIEKYNFLSLIRQNVERQVDNPVDIIIRKTKFRKALAAEVVDSKFGQEMGWNIFISFLEFRHAIAHSLPSYQQKKEALILQMRTQKNLLNVADKILKQLDSINRIKRVTA